MSSTGMSFTSPMRPPDLETRAHTAMRDWRFGFFVIVLAILQQCFGHLNRDAAALMTFAGSGVSLHVCGRILRQAEYLNASEKALLWIAALYVLLFVAAVCFAGREHLALLALLPFLTAAMVRAKGEDLTLSSIMAAGLGTGIYCLFKPYFALPVAMCAILVA